MSDRIGLSALEADYWLRKNTSNEIEYGGNRYRIAIDGVDEVFRPDTNQWVELERDAWRRRGCQRFKAEPKDQVLRNAIHEFCDENAVAIARLSKLLKVHQEHIMNLVEERLKK